MSVYVVEPVDTQFYRSSLPFDAGADGHSTTQPIPWPRTVYGAFRALGFSLANASLAIGESPSRHETWGTYIEKGDLTLKGPFLYQTVPGLSEILLPMPADLAAETKGECCLRHCVPATDRKEDETDCFGGRWDLGSLNLVKVLKEEAEVRVENLAEERLLPSGSPLEGYLLQELDGVSARGLPKWEEVCTVESRVGIKRSHSAHTAEEGWLYAAPHYRLQTLPGVHEFGYWVKIERENGVTVSLPPEGVLRLGGESRPARYRRQKSDGPLQETWAAAFRHKVIRAIEEGGRFKLYLITPGLFGGRAWPEKLAGGKGCSFLVYPHGKARLAAVAMQKRIHIGGWDIQRQCPKVLEAGVPAGSVYFFKIEDWPEEQMERSRRAALWFDALNFQSLCAGDCAKEGFGIALVGGWHV